MIAGASFLLILLLSLLIVRVATVMLTHTGLSKPVARFQARSAVTGTGFTTTEAESIVRHPVRRRIISVLMLLQSAGLVTATSSLILSFTGVQHSEEGLLRLAWIAGGLAVLWVAAASRWVDQRLGRIISWALDRWTHVDTRDYLNLLHLAENYRVRELPVEEDEWLADRPLSELDLPEEGVLVLGIERHDGGGWLGVPQSDTCLRPGDTVVLYGREGRLRELDERRRDREGERARQEAVREQHEVEAREQARGERGAEDDPG